MKHLAVALGFFGAALLLWPLAYWLQRPELTEMQVCLENIPTTILGAISCFAGLAIFRYAEDRVRDTESGEGG